MIASAARVGVSGNMRYVASVNMRKNKMTKHEKLIRLNGGSFVESYSLVNNYGYTFTLDGRRYDARFWENCYGSSPRVWEVMSIMPSGEKYVPPSLEAKHIQKLLNDLGSEY